MSATDFIPLEHLDVNDIDGITDWHERFDQYCIARSIDATSKISHYITLIGRQAYRLIKDLAYPKAVTSLTVKELQTLVENHLLPADYELAEREKFHNLTKKTEESYRSFLLRVQQQSAKCNFGSALEIQLRDRLVAGITNQDVKRKLLKETKLDFQLAKNILIEWDAINSEVSQPTDVMGVSTSKHRKPQRHVQSLRPTVQRPSDSSNFKQQRPQQFHHRRPPTGLTDNKQLPTASQNAYQPYRIDKKQSSCDSCGGPHLRRTCKFRSAICRSCNKPGHIQRVCRSNTAKVRTTTTTTPIDNSDADIRVFTVDKSSSASSGSLRHSPASTTDNPPAVDSPPHCYDTSASSPEDNFTSASLNEDVPDFALQSHSTTPALPASTPQSPCPSTCTPPEDNSDTEVTVFTVEHPSHLHETVRFRNGQNKEFILDTGSPVTFLPLREFNSLGLSNSDLSPSSTSIQGVSGHKLTVLGQFDAHVSVKDNNATINFKVTQNGPSILGLDALRSLRVNIALYIQPPELPPDIKQLIAACHKNTGGLKIEPVDLDVTGPPKFLKARPIPYGLRPAVENNIKELVNSGILKPVNSSAWATPIVTPLKANGQPRICGDYRITVNPQLLQTSAITPTVEDMFEGLKDSILFTKIDLSNAFLQIPLSENAKAFTTINTSWGLFQYQFLPFGLHQSSGIFQRAINQKLNGLQGVRSYQDDIIVIGKSRQEHDTNLLQLLKALKNHNVQINMQKSQFAVNKLHYLGYVIDGTGISPDTNRIEALKSASIPDSAEKLQSFLGFAQYYSKFVPQFAALANPLYNALKEFDSAKIEQDYKKLLNALLNGKVLKSYQFGAPTQLIVDASSHALGAVLEQKGHPITCISRKLSKSEENYSQVQKEALAIHWSVTRLHKFLFGNPFEIITDHRALEFIFHPSSSIGKTTSSMMQRWAMQLSGYNYTIKHKPGASIANADYLSRHAKHEPPEETSACFVNPFPLSRYELIKETKSFYGPVIAGLTKGWSNSAKRRFPRLYAQRNDLQVQADSAIMFQERLLIPPVLRNQMLEHLHLGHMGRDKMTSLSRMLCWWPSVNADIQVYNKECKQCRKKPRSHPNWSPWPICFQPMQRLHADYCGPFLGQYYALVTEDAYSKFPEVFLTTSPTAAFTKLALQKLFAREGVPQALITDNGTTFTATSIQNWLKAIGCRSVFSLPRHPQSNGQAENFIRTLKIAIKAVAPTSIESLHQAIDTFLLQYRSAVHSSTKKSPALLFKGRNLRTSSLDTTDIIFYRGNDNRPCEGLILNRIGNRLYSVMDRSDSSVHRRHVDQITFTPPETPKSLKVNSPDTLSEHIPSHVTPSVLPSSPSITQPVQTQSHTPTSEAASTSPTTPTIPSSPASQVPVPEQRNIECEAGPRRSQRQRRKPVRYDSKDFK